MKKEAFFLVSLKARGSFAVGAFFVLAISGFVASAEAIFPNPSGEALVTKLREAYVPTRVLDYSAARLQLFSQVENRNGRVTLCYTGQEYITDQIPPANE